ncbi:MAG: hypothetical protein ACF8NJ_08565 [Phycisphaerales bacterium JB038]
MTRAKRIMMIGGAGLTLLLATGCTGYHQITDPNASRLYFSRSLTVEGSTGDLVMKDDLREIEVRLSEYEVKNLSRDDYRKATANLKR